jgi:hypothetical protein
MRPVKLLVAAALATTLFAAPSAAVSVKGIGGISFASLGAPCAWAPAPDHTLKGSAAPARGANAWSVDFKVDTTAKDADRHVFVLGFTRGGLVFPRPMGGCPIVPSLDFLRFLPGTTGAIETSFSVPDDASLIGVVAYAQVVHLDAPLVPTAVSNALLVEID